MRRMPAHHMPHEHMTHDSPVNDTPLKIAGSPNWEVTGKTFCLREDLRQKLRRFQGHLSVTTGLGVTSHTGQGWVVSHLCPGVRAHRLLDDLCTGPQEGEDAEAAARSDRTTRRCRCRPPPRGAAGRRRKKDDPELQAEKHSIFAGSERDVLHPEVHKAIPMFWERFFYSFDTDGVGASVHMRRCRAAPAGGAPSVPPRPRGHWCPRTTRWVAADELPARGLYSSVEEFRERTGWGGRSGDACIVGIDPGVIEIISAVALDTAAHVKYTNQSAAAGRNR
eukprot:scaffold10540_cov116-Isochrysis_galbana.AAC.5